MRLTGWPLLGLLLALCVALPALALFGWSRFRPRLLAIILCAGLLGLSEVSAMALIAAAVNRSGGYYTTWSQVLGSFDTPPGISHVRARPGIAAGGPTANAGASLTAHADPRFSTAAQWPTRGRLESLRLVGANSGLTSRALLYLPPAYFQAKDRHVNFPAAEVFTGYPGLLSSLVHGMNYPGVLGSEMAGGRAKPMVLLMIRPSVTYPRDTECTDVPAGPQALTFFAQDVTSAVDQHYRVQPDRWGAIGDSTGGYCSAKLAMNYPGTFRAAVSLSGYYHALRDHTTGDLWGGSAVIRDQNDLRWRLQHQSAPAVSLLVTISRDEKGPLGVRDTQRFIQVAKPPLRLDTIITAHGAHNFHSWKVLLPQSLDWLSARLSAPRSA